ncbi:hypothetical protein ACWGNE_02480 [Streptomyces xiamenensis]
MPFPWRPGMRVTADRLNASSTHVVQLEADLPLVNRTTPLATDIRVPLIAGATYQYWLLISYSAASGADTSISANWSVPTGTEMLRFTISYQAVASNTTGANAGQYVIMRRPANGTGHVIGGTTAGNYHSARDEGLITVGGAGGTAIWQVQQGGAGASTGTIIRGGPTATRIVYRRIG